MVGGDPQVAARCEKNQNINDGVYLTTRYFFRKIGRVRQRERELAVIFRVLMSKLYEEVGNQAFSEVSW